VLENGPASRYASYFDVDWDPPETRLRNVVLLPVLADHYGRVLERGDLRLCRDGVAFTIRYHDYVFPVSPQSLDSLLAIAAERTRSEALAFIADALSELPSPITTDHTSVERRHRHKTVLYESLARLFAEEPHTAEAVDAVVADVNGSVDSLDALLERQNFRLAHWRAAARDLGYRRFFDINGLVGLRGEHEHVFRDTHRLVLAWLMDGTLDGLRIDHPDGLRDPEAYFDRLREAGPEAWITVEKILQPGEALRDSWPVDGTTGYDFLNRVSGLFVDPEGEKALTELYAEFTGESTDWAEVARAKKHQVMRETMGSDLNRLTALFLEVCERRRRYRDYTRHELHEALRDTLACFPVYRTYVRSEPAAVDEDDARRIVEATETARAHRADLDGELFEFLRDLLRRRLVGDLETELLRVRARACRSIRQTLQLRRRRPALFGAEGTYRPLSAIGARSGHVVAFARGDGEISVVPRLVMRLEDNWMNTALELPPGRWRNELTGDAMQGMVPVAELLAQFPVALLARAEPSA
jgi:(1->4)-alpha-D-glucan 1-alpha-D-glucosylmutase